MTVSVLALRCYREKHLSQPFTMLKLRDLKNCHGSVRMRVCKGVWMCVCVLGVLCVLCVCGVVCVLCGVCCVVLCAVLCCVLCAVCCVLCAVCCVLCAVCCVLCCVLCGSVDPSWFLLYSPSFCQVAHASPLVRRVFSPLSVVVTAEL